MATISHRMQDGQTKNQLPVYNLEDIKKVDFSQIKSIDPTRLNLGTELQDAFAVTRAYERGAHYTPKEVAIFATLNRHLENYKHISKNMKTVLKTYVMVPENSLSKQMLEASQLAKNADIEIPQANTGKGKGSQETSQALDMKNFNQATEGSKDFGDKVQDWLQDCIPCDLRLSSWLEIHPNVDLMGLMEKAIEGMTDFLNGLSNLLRNLDVFGDFCALMDLFNFTCIPDLQRILALLSTLLAFEMPSLDGLLGLIQCLIAPLLSPLLNGILSLLDQFQLLVANPLECIVDALNQQIAKLPTGDNPIFQNKLLRSTDSGKEITDDLRGVATSVAGTTDPTTGEKIPGALNKATAIADNVASDIGGAVKILQKLITDTIAMVQEKMDFYLGDLRALMNDMSSVDASYIAASLKKLQIVRLVSFISALITALASGNMGFCKNEGPPEQHEIDNFYNNYLGPNMAFAVSIDQHGTMTFKAKNQKTLPQRKDLPNRENVFEFEGKDIVNERLIEVARKLTSPIQVVKPCRLKVTASEATLMNRYVSELNSL